MSKKEASVSRIRACASALTQHCLHVVHTGWPADERVHDVPMTKGRCLLAAAPLPHASGQPPLHSMWPFLAMSQHYGHCVSWNAHIGRFCFITKLFLCRSVWQWSVELHFLSHDFWAQMCFLSSFLGASSFPLLSSVCLVCVSLEQ